MSSKAKKRIAGIVVALIAFVTIIGLTDIGSVLPQAPATPSDYYYSGDRSTPEPTPEPY